MRRTASVPAAAPGRASAAPGRASAASGRASAAPGRANVALGRANVALGRANAARPRAVVARARSTVMACAALMLVLLGLPSVAAAAAAKTTGARPTEHLGRKGAENGGGARVSLRSETLAQPAVGLRDTFRTRTVVVAGHGKALTSEDGAASDRSLQSGSSAALAHGLRPQTGGGESGMFVAPQPVNLGSLDVDGGGVVSLDTGEFDSQTNSNLGVALISCSQCSAPEPYQSPFQSSPNNEGAYDLSVLLGNGDGTFGAPTQLAPPANMSAATQSDPDAFSSALSMVVAKDLGNGESDLLVGVGSGVDVSSEDSDQAMFLVYLGNGNGTFQAPIEVDSPAPIVRLQAANLGDGQVDVVALVSGQSIDNLDGSTSANAIVVFTGNGAGGFTAGTPIILPSGTPTDLALAPLANGGEPSIIATVSATGSEDNVLSVLFNNGSGGFPSTPWNPSFSTTIADPDGIEVGNFDGASNPPDVLLAGDGCTDSFASDSCQVTLDGNGDGTFQTPTASNSTALEGVPWRGPEDDAGFDLNEGANPDALWMADWSGESTDNGAVEIALSNGAGGFTSQDDVGVGPANVQTSTALPADLDGSGLDDLLVGGVIVYQGQTTTDSPGSGLWVVPANPKTPGTYETGQGYFQVPLAATEDAWSQTDQSMAVGNFQGNGNQDIATVDCSDVFLGTCDQLTVATLPGKGDGTFGALSTETFSESNMNPAYGLVSGDFSGNGNLDLAFIYNQGPGYGVPGGGGLQYLMGNGNGTFQAPVTVAVPSADQSEIGQPTAGSLVYTTLDGEPDLVASVEGGAGEYLESYLWNGTGFSAPVVSGPLPALSRSNDQIALGDFDSSDALDVVTMIQGADSDEVAVISGSADGSFDTADPTIVADACPSAGANGAVAAGDLTGDGNDDVLWQCNGDLWVALGNGNDSFSSPQSYAEGLPGQNSQLFLAPLEGSGNLDAVAYGTTCPCADASGVEVWHGNGDGTFAPGLDYSAGMQLYSGLVEAAPLTSSDNDDLLAMWWQAGSDILTVMLSTGGRPALEASDVSSPTPSSPAPGNIVTGSYTVADTGGAASASWDDSVYLASGASGTTYTTADPLLERIPETQSLGSGGTYDVDYSFPLPDVAPGQYHLIVVPDSGDVLSGGNETPAASPAFTIAPITTLAVGAPSISTTVQQDDPLYYQVDVSSSDVQVSLGELSDDSDVTLLAQNGQVPTLQSATIASVSGTIDLPSSDPGTWYVVVEPNDTLSSSAQPVSVEASEIGLTLGSSSPSTDVMYVQPPAVASAGGGGGEPIAPPPPPPPQGDGMDTLTLQGSGFGSDLSVDLVSGGVSIPAVSVTRESSTRAFATFDVDPFCTINTDQQLLGCTAPTGATGTPVGPGTYDVKVSSSGQSQTLHDAFTLYDTYGYGSPGETALNVNVSAPYELRQGWVGELAVTLQNNTSEDLAVPVIDVSSTDNSAVLGPPGTDDTADFGATYELDDPVLSADPALDPAPPGILPGGESVTIDVGILSNTTTAHAALNTTTTVLNSSDSTPIDWTTELASDQPPEMSDAGWAQVVDNVASMAGSTNGSYALELVSIFHDALDHGLSLGSVGDALQYLVQEAEANGTGASVSGTLYDNSTSTPLPLAEMSLDNSAGELVANAESDFDGDFGFYGVPAGTYDLEVNDHLPRPADSVTVGSGSTGLSVVVNDGATITGTVTDSSDNPIASAVVSVTDAEGVVSSDPTDATGTYTLTGVDPGAVSVAAEAPGLIAPTAVATTAVAGSPATVNFEFPSGGAISGVVDLPGGTPDASAQIEITPSGSTTPAVSGLIVNSDGTFDAGGLPVGSYTVTAADSADGYGAVSQSGVSVSAGGDTSGIDLTLTAGVTVSGQVTDATTGLPVEGALVSSLAGGAPAPVSTDDNGDFSVSGLPAGTQQLEVSDATAGYATTDVSINPAAGASLTEDVELDEGGSLTASVLTSGGTPITDATLDLVAGADAVANGEAPSQLLSTDDSGDLGVDGLANGTYDLQLAGSDAQASFTISADNTNVSLTLTVPEATVSGVVEASGAGVSGVGVALSDSSGQVATTTTAADGSFSFPVTAAGSYDVVASGPSVGILIDPAVAVSATDLQNGTAVVAPTLEAGSSILNVDVTTSGDAPDASADVALSFGSKADQPDALGAVSNSSGVASFSDLIVGNYKLTIDDGSSGSIVEAVSVGSGTTTSDVQLVAGGSISGTVTDGSGPVTAASVQVEQGSTVLSGASTGSNGTYTISGLAPGSYGVSISDGTDVPDELSGIIVSAGGTTTESADLSSSGQTITLQVDPDATEAASAGGGAVPALVAEVIDSQGGIVASGDVGPAVSGSDAAASVQLGPVAPGDYMISLSGPGTATTTKPVTVTGSGASLQMTAPAGEVLTSSFGSVAGSPAESSSGSKGSSGGVRPALSRILPQFSFTGLFSINPVQLVQLWTGNAVSPPDTEGVGYLLSYAHQYLNLLEKAQASCKGPNNQSTINQLLALMQAVTSAFQGWQSAYQAVSAQRGTALFNQAVDAISDTASAIGAGIKSQAVVQELESAVKSNALVQQLAKQAGYSTTQVANAANTVLGGVATGSGIQGQLLSASASNPGSFEKLSSYFSALVGALQITLAVLSLAVSSEAVAAALGTAATVAGVVGAITGFIQLIHEISADVSDAQTLINNDLQAYNLYNAKQQALGQFLNGIPVSSLKSGTANCPPPPPPNTPNPQPPHHTSQPQNLEPNDPNQIIGSAGDATSSQTTQYVQPGATLPYTILFENDGSAPATEVFVTMQLPSGVDPSSVELTGFGFGQTSVPISDPGTSFSDMLTDLDLANGDDVSATGSFDPTTGTISWAIEAIDPATGDVDGSPTGGFLPPDDAAGDGDGFVSFQVKVDPTTTTGTSINAQASIVFDTNAAIATNVWTNVVDGTAPSATVESLPATETGPFSVAWSGTTPGAPIASYDVFVSEDGAAYTEWQSATSATSATYPGQIGHNYSFFAVASDDLGNAQVLPSAAQAFTAVVSTSSGSAPASGSGGSASTTTTTTTVARSPSGASPAAPPSITALSRSAGTRSGGTVVLIRGSGFTAAVQVHFGTHRARFKVLSASEIRAISPRGQGTVAVWVTTKNGTSARKRADRFAYLGAAVIVAISPDKGPKAGRTVVTIRGRWFQHVEEVRFGARRASFKVVSAEVIRAVATPGSGTVEVRVTTAAGTSALTKADRYSYST